MHDKVHEVLEGYLLLLVVLHWILILLPQLVSSLEFEQWDVKALLSAPDKLVRECRCHPCEWVAGEQEPLLLGIQLGIDILDRQGSVVKHELVQLVFGKHITDQLLIFTCNQGKDLHPGSAGSLGHVAVQQEVVGRSDQRLAIWNLCTCIKCICKYLEWKPLSNSNHRPKVAVVSMVLPPSIRILLYSYSIMTTLH